jgi:hypothetical protein
VSADSGRTITLPCQSGIAKTGYVSAGWNTNSAGTGTAYNVGASFPVTRDTTLFVDWRILRTITFDANGAGGYAPDPRSVGSGISTTLPGKGEMVRAGHAFGGWNTKNDGTGTAYAAGASFTTAADVTLYAVWTANADSDEEIVTFEGEAWVLFCEDRICGEGMIFQPDGNYLWVWMDGEGNWRSSNTGGTWITEENTVTIIYGTSPVVYEFFISGDILTLISYWNDVGYEQVYTKLTGLQITHELGKSREGFKRPKSLADKDKAR